MKNKCWLLALLVFTAIPCLFAQKNIAERKVLIDIPNLSGGTVSEVFQETEYIPLENTKDSQINRIEKIEVTEKHYIILDDHRPNKILLFDKQGKFFKKIEGVPNYKIEDGFRELWIDQDTKEIITEIFSFKDGIYFAYFDYNGNYLRKEKAPLNIENFLYVGKNTFAGSNSYYQENAYKKAKKLDSVKYHVTLFKDNKVVKQYLPIDTAIRSSEMDDIFSNSLALNVSDKSFTFINSGSYKILNIDKDGIRETYNILFPLKNSLPNDIMGKTYQGKRFGLAKDNSDLIYGLQDQHKLNNWLFFSGKHWNGMWDKVLYNLQTSTALEMEKIAGDSSNGYLPVISINGVVGSDTANLYTAITSATMFQTREEMAAKKPIYSKLLTEYYKSSSRLGNPVLIRLKLKADF